MAARPESGGALGMGRGGLIHCAGMIWGVQDVNISYLG